MERLCPHLILRLVVQPISNHLAFQNLVCEPSSSKRPSSLCPAPYPVHLFATSPVLVRHLAFSLSPWDKIFRLLRGSSFHHQKKMYWISIKCKVLSWTIGLSGHQSRQCPNSHRGPIIDGVVIYSSNLVTWPKGLDKNFSRQNALSR